MRFSLTNTFSIVEHTYKLHNEINCILETLFFYYLMCKRIIIIMKNSIIDTFSKFAFNDTLLDIIYYFIFLLGISYAFFFSSFLFYG